MLFGLFGKKSNKDGLIEKGKKLAAQGRTAEALTYFEDAAELDPSCETLRELMGECRVKLVELNVEEALALKNHDPERAVEHARLALDLAGDNKDLAKKAGEALAQVVKGVPAKAVKKEESKRLFEPSCGCASPSCNSHEGGCGDEGAGVEEFHEDPDDLFYFYLETADPEEKVAFEDLGPAFRRGYVALIQGNADEAGVWFGQARKESGNTGPLCYVGGMLAWQKEDFRTADKLLSEAIRLSPDFGPAVRRRATLLREAQLPAEAVSCLEGWVEGHPEDKEGLTIYAAALAEAGRSRRAWEVFGPYAETAHKTNPGLALLWAHILLADQRADEAITVLRTAVTVQPDLLDAQEILGIQLTRKGGREAEGAVKAFKHCYKKNPEKGWYYLLRLCEAYKSMGQPDQAKKFLDEAFDELPETEEARNIWDTVAANLNREG